LLGCMQSAQMRHSSHRINIAMEGRPALMDAMPCFNRWHRQSNSVVDQ
jgi:hypothetical protein